MLYYYYTLFEYSSKTTQEDITNLFLKYQFKFLILILRKIKQKIKLKKEVMPIDCIIVLKNKANIEKISKNYIKGKEMLNIE